MGIVSLHICASSKPRLRIHPDKYAAVDPMSSEPTTVTRCMPGEEIKRRQYLRMSSAHFGRAGTTLGERVPLAASLPRGPLFSPGPKNTKHSSHSTHSRPSRESRCSKVSSEIYKERKARVSVRAWTQSMTDGDINRQVLPESGKARRIQKVGIGGKPALFFFLKCDPGTSWGNFFNKELVHSL